MHKVIDLLCVLQPGTAVVAFIHVKNDQQMLIAFDNLITMTLCLEIYLQ